MDHVQGRAPTASDHRSVSLRRAAREHVERALPAPPIRTQDQTLLPAMTDTTFLRDLFSLAAGVLLLAGLLTLSVAAASSPGTDTALAGGALLAAGAAILRAQNPRFPRRRIP